MAVAGIAAAAAADVEAATKLFPMKKMKIDSPAVENCDLKVWCEYCSIRIAPNEERTTSDGKMYHQRCYSKSSAATKVRSASAQTRSAREGKR